MELVNGCVVMMSPCSFFFNFNNNCRLDSLSTLFDAFTLDEQIDEPMRKNELNVNEFEMIASSFIRREEREKKKRTDRITRSMFDYLDEFSGLTAN